MFYFAYGSNMSVPRLRSRVSSARVLGAAQLCGHALEFRKRGADGSAKCDLAVRDDRVAGVLFKIDAEQRAALDSAEGYGHGYLRKTVEVEDHAGTVRQAFTYYAIDVSTQLKPYHWYCHHVISGALLAGLSAHYIERLRTVESVADPDQDRQRRELAIYPFLAPSGRLRALASTQGLNYGA
jgi:gamma-glutamylcyclotransferase